MTGKTMLCPYIKPNCY